MKNITFEIQPNNNDTNSICIHLGGDLSLKGVTGLRSKLVEIKDQYNKVEMNVGDVTTLDLSAIQLLLSLKKTFQSLNKELQINFSLAPEMIDLVIKGGFEELLTGNKKLADN
jgi:ABC-type transporter Mla MlaB component